MVYQPNVVINASSVDEFRTIFNLLSIKFLQVLLNYCIQPAGGFFTAGN